MWILVRWFVCVSVVVVYVFMYGSVVDFCIYVVVLGGEEEVEGMVCVEEDGEDECLFFGDDLLVVFVVVGVVEEGIECCGGE